MLYLEIVIYVPVFGYGSAISICDQSNINYGSDSWIYSYTPPTYPSGSDQFTFLIECGGWLTTEIEVY